MNSTIDNVPDRQRQTTIIFDQTVADRIESLLARVEGVRRGATIDRPTRFNREGERHARRVAQADQSRGTSR